MLTYLPISVQIYLTVLCFVLGAVLGSGLNCLAYRMARGQKWTKGHSVCPACGARLKALDLIPVVSWLALKGKCRSCKAPVSPRYFLTELGLGLLFAATLWRFGLTVELGLWLVFECCLFCLSLVDLETQIIPDRFLLIPAVLRLVWLLAVGGLGSLWAGLWPGLVVGGAVLVLSLVMDKILKKDSMGGGDIKLLAVLGLYFGLAQSLLLVVIACFVGIALAAALVKAKPGAAFPFGPALAAAAVITMFIGQPVIAWYLGLF